MVSLAQGMRHFEPSPSLDLATRQLTLPQGRESPYLNSAHDPPACRGRQEVQPRQPSPHIRAEFDASLIRFFSPSTWISVPRGPEICTNQYSHRRSAGKGQSVPLSYHYLYPLRTGHLRICHSGGPRTPLPTLLFLPHARTSSCLSPGRRQHLIAGTILVFRYLPHSYRQFENVPAVLCQLLACTEFTFPKLTAPHFSPHPNDAKNCFVHTTIVVEYVLLRNSNTPAGLNDIYD